MTKMSTRITETASIITIRITTHIITQAIRIIRIIYTKRAACSTNSTTTIKRSWLVASTSSTIRRARRPVICHLRRRRPRCPPISTTQRNTTMNWSRRCLNIKQNIRQNRNNLALRREKFIKIIEIIRTRDKLVKKQRSELRARTSADRLDCLWRISIS